MPSLDVAISNVGSLQNVSTSRPELKALSTSRSAQELTYSQHSDENEWSKSLQEMHAHRGLQTSCPVLGSIYLTQGNILDKSFTRIHWNNYL